MGSREHCIALVVTRDDASLDLGMRSGTEDAYIQEFVWRLKN